MPIDPRHLALAADTQEADPGSLLQFKRTLVALRKASPALRGPRAAALALRAALVGCERGDGRQRTLRMLNLGAEARRHGVALEGRHEAMQVGEASGTALGPYAAAIHGRA